MLNRTLENLSLGLTRIFSEYGWTGEGAPKNFSSRLETIKYGIQHGYAYQYYTHISMLYQAREKDNKWGIFSPTYVRGMKRILEQIIEYEGKKNPTEPQKEFNIEVPSGNIFKTTAHGKKAISLIKHYGNTCIRYNDIEVYGVDRVLSDLREIFPKATLTVSTITSPDIIRHLTMDHFASCVVLLTPVLPGVILTDGKKHRNKN